MVGLVSFKIEKLISSLISMYVISDLSVILVQVRWASVQNLPHSRVSRFRTRSYLSLSRMLFFVLVVVLRFNMNIYLKLLMVDSPHVYNCFQNQFSIATKTFLAGCLCLHPWIPA